MNRARPGTFIYAIVAFIYAITVLDRALDFQVAIVAGVALFAIGVGRRWFYTQSQLRADVTRWRFTFAALSSLTVFVFDTFVAFALWHRACAPGSLLMLAASMAMRGSGMHTTSPDRVVMSWFSRWTRPPVLIACLLVFSQVSIMLIVLLALHAMYVELHGSQMNREYWLMVAATEEAAVAHAELKQEVAMRERAEVELRLAQKLESVGRLAAGIAHEINTPLQVMVGSLHFADEGVRELVAIAQRYRALATAGATSETDHDLEYLREHLPDALSLAQNCLDRTATIVRSVKTFAIVDAAEKSSVDLNESIKTTLALCRREYADVADIRLELGAIPRVECYAGELHQALFNIVINAAHAIEDHRSSDARGTITVTTSHERDHVRISIADTGGGIPAEIRDRIFDPFFTTKEVGRGTGQGLAVARSVVAQRHGGELSFTSELGRGTTFVIRVPAPRAVLMAAA